MSAPEFAPNGMRMLQRVRVHSAAGLQYGSLATGMVVGWQYEPTIVIRGDDGQNRHVSSKLPWEPLDDEPDDGGVLIRDDGRVSIRVGNSTWTMTPAEWHALASAPVEEAAP